MMILTTRQTNLNSQLKNISEVGNQIRDAPINDKENTNVEDNLA